MSDKTKKTDAEAEAIEAEKPLTEADYIARRKAALAERGMADDMPQFDENGNKK